MGSGMLQFAKHQVTLNAQNFFAYSVLLEKVGNDSQVSCREII
jgi:hypothetical protein